MPRPLSVPKNRRLGPLLGGLAVIGALILAGVLLVGGYFEHDAYALLLPERALKIEDGPKLAAVYWSGDMGMRVGIGEGLVDELAASGIPVLTVSSPMLFAQARDRAFVDDAVARSVRRALAETGAQRVVVIGNSFGADIIGAGLGRVPGDLRRRIAAVVLMVPGNDVFFHANPTGIFYRGPVAASPAHTIPLLRGLPVTCIYGADEEGSLCRAPVMATASRIAIDDGHLMLWSRQRLFRAVLGAIAHPPRPMT